MRRSSGRRPAGLSLPGHALVAKRSKGSSVGNYFARVAHLEAASVVAFRALKGELERFGAPQRLRKRAEGAMRDEVRHARAMAVLARGWGSRVPGVRIRRTKQRSLEAIAVENAVEGCVRETFGALLAMHQSQAATEPSVRDAMTRIAHDEVGHAALAWSVARWTDAKLDVAARKRVAQATRDAITTLARELSFDPPRDLQIAAGLPNATQAKAMIRTLEGSIWAATI